MSISAVEISHAFIMIEPRSYHDELAEDVLERHAEDVLAKAGHIIKNPNKGTAVERAEALFYLMRRYEQEHGNVDAAWPATWETQDRPLAEIIEFAPLA